MLRRRPGLIPRATSLIAVLLVCSRLAAAEIVSPELPVSEPRLAPDASTTCGVIAGDTKAYAFCSTAGQLFLVDLEPDGKPILSTRVTFPARAVATAGDALFYAATGDHALVLRRLGSDAEVRIDATDVARPRLVWNHGALLLLVWASGDTMMGAIFDTGLHVAVPPFAIMPAGTWWPTVATAGGGFMVVGHDSTHATGVIVDANGAVHPVALPVPSTWFDALASNGSEYFYLWQRDRTPLAAQRYSAAGNAAGDIAVITQSGTGDLYFPSVVWTGSDYLVAWRDGDNTSWICTPGSAPRPLGTGLATLFAGPSGVFVTMTNASVAQTIRRLDTNGPEHVLGFGPTSQASLAIAMDGLDAAVLWSEDSGNGEETRIGRIGPDGSRRDGAGVALPAKAFHSAMAFDGTNELVVWMANKHVYGLFFGREAGSPFIIANEPNDSQVPAVTWTGTNYLVTWSGVAGLGTGAAVTTSGGVTPFLFDGFGEQSSPSSGPRTLVVFERSEGGFSKISGVFLDAAGSSFDIVRESTIGTFRNVSSPRVVSNGRDYLVTWTLQAQPSHSEAWIARLDDRGRLIGQPFAIASSDAWTWGASAIPLFDGTNYRVAVRGDQAMPLFVATVHDDTFSCRCHDDRVAVPVNFDIARQSWFFVAAASRDAVAIAYYRTSDPGVTRAFVRFVRTAPPPRRRAAR